MKTLMALLVIFLLSGCVGSPFHNEFILRPRIQEAERQIEAIRRECQQKYRAKELKTYRETYHCIHSGTRPIYSDNGYPYMDLIDLQFAYEAALAERVDANALSTQDADLLYAQLIVQINNEKQRRDLLTQQANLQSQQARQQAWQDTLRMLNDNMQRQMDRDAFRTMPPITCTQLGNVITCR